MASEHPSRRCERGVGKGVEEGVGEGVGKGVWKGVEGRVDGCVWKAVNLHLPRKVDKRALPRARGIGSRPEGEGTFHLDGPNRREVALAQQRADRNREVLTLLGVHGAGGEPDSQLDLNEFGWYLADICEGFNDPKKAMSGVIQKFEELLVGPEETR